MILNNLSVSTQTVKLPPQYHKKCLDLFAGGARLIAGEFTLDPRSCHWLKMQK